MICSGDDDKTDLRVFVASEDGGLYLEFHRP